MSLPAPVSPWYHSAASCLTIFCEECYHCVILCNCLFLDVSKMNLIAVCYVEGCTKTRCTSSTVQSLSSANSPIMTYFPSRPYLLQQQQWWPLNDSCSMGMLLQMEWHLACQCPLQLHLLHNTSFAGHVLWLRGWSHMQLDHESFNFVNFCRIFFIVFGGTLHLKTFTMNLVRPNCIRLK